MSRQGLAASLGSRKLTTRYKSIGAAIIEDSLFEQVHSPKSLAYSAGK